MPLSQHPYLAYLTRASGIMAMALGINALLNPSGALSMWGFPHPGAVPDNNDPSSTKPLSVQKIIPTPEGRLAESLMMLYGSRTATLGVALLATSLWGSRRACAAVVWGATFIATMDGVVSKRTIGGGEWSHWGFVPVGVVLGSLMSGFAD